LQNLEHFELSRCTFTQVVPSSYVEDMLHNLKHLKAFVACFCTFTFEGEMTIAHEKLQDFWINGYTHKWKLKRLHCNNLRNLGLDIPNEEVSDALLEDIINTPFLRDVAITPLPFPKRQPLLKKLYFLQELRLGYSVNGLTMEAGFFESLPLRLTAISLRAQLTDLNLKELGQHFQRLNSLTLENCTTLTSLEALQSGSLQHLRLLSIKGLTGTMSLSGLPNIRYLNISSDPTAYRTWDILITNKPFLQKLQLSCPDLGSIKLENNMRLKMIHIGQASHLTAVDIDSPALEEFTLKRASKLSSINRFVCPRLRSLSMKSMSSWADHTFVSLLVAKNPRLRVSVDPRVNKAQTHHLGL
jgi:hypothetical protein